ncbi:hypothetical protein PV703_13005 [Streptomyces sp. ME01-24h]|nr:hypothetical protein [Streptomyces sp. ME19-03-3]MDX3215348.1 hypothetical protein [Streptomyces sp. ME02-6991-2B]MDX3354204.1 hypothetical protein [Streptomyces sp. ME01-24h]
MAERGSDGPDAEGTDDTDDARTQAARNAERGRRRAAFLRELDEARQLRDRVQPRRARAARARLQMRMRTFRW